MGEWRYNSTILIPSALDGGDWSASRPGRFTRGEIAPVPTGQEAGWAPEPVWTLSRRENLASAGNRTWVFQHVVLTTEDVVCTEIVWLWVDI
jgi:hypothetical protein